MNESLSFSHDFVSISWCMASVFLSVCLFVSLCLGDARIMGGRKASKDYGETISLLLEYGPLTTIVVDK